MADPATLLLVTILAIGLLLMLVLWVKLHPFLALLITAMFLGIASGMPLEKVSAAIQNGLGGTLGFVATVVGIGSIFGQILETSGGTEAIAKTLIQWFGKKRAHWSLSIAGFLIAIPVFFDVGFIILVPVVYALAKDTKKSTLYYAIPLLAGLAVTHTFIPPTPGPVAVADMLGADLGWVILVGAIIGLPITIIAFVRHLYRKQDTSFSSASRDRGTGKGRRDRRGASVAFLLDSIFHHRYSVAPDGGQVDDRVIYQIRVYA